MSTADVGVELDDATKGDLAPLCDRLSVLRGVLVGSPCDQVAVWAVTTRCPNCGPRGPLLRCAVHGAQLFEGARVTCLTCKSEHDAYVISAVRL